MCSMQCCSTVTASVSPSRQPPMEMMVITTLLVLLLLAYNGCYAFKLNCARSLHIELNVFNLNKLQVNSNTPLRSRVSNGNCYRSTILQATTSTSTESKCPVFRFSNFLQVLWDFTRPHTILGSGLSVLFLYAFASPHTSWFKKPFSKSLSSSLLPALLMNVYITGLNQCTDIEIDKINKPYLPIAAGKLSKESGIFIVIASLLASLYLAQRSEWPLQMVLLGSGLLGTLYSLEPFRLKRFPLLAALCILTVRGSLVNFGFFFQAKMQVMGVALPSFSQAVKAFPESLLVTLFFAIFGVVIAIMKDVPDVEGDLIYKIPSFSVKLGAGKMFRFAWKLLFGLLIGSSTACLGLLGLNYNTIGMGRRLGRLTLGGVLMTLALDLRRRAIQINNTDSKQIFDYYMYTWNVFYACYALLPLLGATFF